MKKKITCYMLISSVLACFFPNAGRGQELTDEMLYMKHHYSIIRELGFQKWILGVNYDGHQTIALVDLSGTANIISRGDGYNKYMIKDIEIVDSRYVYYCGSRVISYTILPDGQGGWVYTPTWGAMFGCFDLATFTTPNVSGLDNLSDYGFESLDKLEVYRIDGETHLVMVGSMDNGNGLVGDFYGNGAIPTFWSYKYASISGEAFDDVAISEKYIVISSRNPNSQSYLRSYEIPAIASQTFFASPVAQIKTDISAHDTILLEYCENDYFALATTNVRNYNIEVAAFDYNLNFYHALTIPLSSYATPMSSLRDVKYNKHLQSLAVLEVFPNEDFFSSKIHHISTNNAPPTSSSIIYGTLYSDERLCSMDYEFHNAGHIVASGNCPSVSARLYQHFPYVYSGCSEEKKTSCSKLNPTRNNYDSFEPRNDEEIARPIEWVASNWLETIICQ